MANLKGCGRKIGPFNCCTVGCTDCLEAMKALPDGCVDAVITDPPYGTGSYPTDNALFGPEVLHGLSRLAFSIAIFGWPEKLVSLSIGTQMQPDEWITWWPTNGACRSMNFAGLSRESEAIAIFGPGDWKALRVPRGKDSRQILRANYQGDGDGRRGLKHGFSAEERYAGDVWVDPSPGLAFNSWQRMHPNEKPESIMLRLVIALTKDGQTILDPFLGSGTTAVAAKKLGRHFLGFEIEQKYVDIANERVALVEAQPNLFEPKPEQLEFVGASGN